MRQDKARENILEELFPDVAESYVNWDLTYGNALEAFMSKRQEVAPAERPALWRVNGPWEDTSNRETPSMGMIHIVRDVVAPTTSATSANKGTSQAGTTKAGGLIQRRIRQ